MFKVGTKVKAIERHVLVGWTSVREEAEEILAEVAIERGEDNVVLRTPGGRLFTAKREDIREV